MVCPWLSVIKTKLSISLRCSPSGNNGYNSFTFYIIKYAVRKCNRHMLAYFDPMTDEDTEKLKGLSSDDEQLTYKV